MALRSGRPTIRACLLTLRDNLKNANSRTNLYLLKLNGSEPQRLWLADWWRRAKKVRTNLSDGRYIAFTRYLTPTATGVLNPTNPREIWLVDSNGQNPRKIADGLNRPGLPIAAAWLMSAMVISKWVIVFVKLTPSILLKSSTNTDREILTTAKIPSDLTPYGIPFGAGTFYLHTPVFLNNDKTLGFVTQGATAIVATIAATGGDLKIWDAQPEGGFGRTFTDPTKGSHLMFKSSRLVASVT